MMINSLKQLLVCLFFIPISCVSIYADTLTILNWEEYLDEDVIEGWEAKTGHKIKQVYFDSDEQRDAMLLSYDGDVIDIAIIDETVSRSYGKNKIMMDLANNEALPNVSHIGDFWRERCSQYSVPYMYGTVGIAYRKDKVEKPPRSWSEYLNPPDSLRGHMSLLKESIDILMPALVVRGYSNTTEDRKELQQAFNDTQKILPYILTFEYPITYVGDNPDDDELHLSMVYSGDQFTMNELQGIDAWHYVIPEDGTVVWTDCMAVLNSSRQKDLALQFINYMNEPAVAAQNSEAIYFATPNNSAKALQSNEFVSDPAVYLNDDDLDKMLYYGMFSPGARQLLNRITHSLLLKHETQ